MIRSVVFQTRNESSMSKVITTGDIYRTSVSKNGAPAFDSRTGAVARSSDDGCVPALLIIAKVSELTVPQTK